MATDRIQKGRDALLEALSGVFDQIEVDLMEDQRAATLKSNETIRAQLDVIGKLRTENEAMRGQLAKLQSSLRTSTDIDQPSTIENTISKRTIVPPSFPASSIVPRKSMRAAGNGCRGNCSKVLRRYHAIAANFKTAKNALQRRKIERKQWVRHVEYLSTKLREAEEKYGIEIIDHQAPGVDFPSATAMEAGEGAFDPALSFISDDSPQECEQELPVLSSKDGPDEEISLTPGTSSQTTQGQASDAIFQPPGSHSPAGNTAIKQEPSSDVPELIAERKVKKRNHADDELGTVTTLVKSELDGGSKPITSSSAPNPNTQESLDLGDIAQKVQTPRKRQSLDQSGPQTDIVSRSKLEAFTPMSARAPVHSYFARLPRQNSAMMPLDGNIRLIRSTIEKPVTKDRRRELAIGVAALSEDCALDEAANTIKVSENFRPKSTKCRLDVLLDGGIEEMDVITASTPTRKQPLAPALEPAHGVPRRRQLPFDKNEDRGGRFILAPHMSTTNHKSAASSRAPMPTLDQGLSTGFLRNKRPSDLCLGDFKINPSANEGHDFAFSEVVREKADRACLPGCIDMHCCGKHFRALAISQRPDSPLTSAQRQEEQKLLEDYLGDLSYRLATMDKEQRMELWIEAKTQELANKYGKHRHRFSRMQTPPGFWDADFPDTQQLEADRQEAVKRTKQAIAERYREALRPGGRWKFMDE